jgi:hypothetical protein
MRYDLTVHMRMYVPTAFVREIRTFIDGAGLKSSDAAQCGSTGFSFCAS